MIAILSSMFTAMLIKQLLTLLGLILLQIILAVALALKQGKFEWRKLADFYRALVLPYILGWLALVIGARLISTELLGTQYQMIVGDSVTWLAWLAVVASLGARILSTAQDIYGSLIPIKLPTDPANSTEVK